MGPRTYYVYRELDSDSDDDSDESLLAYIAALLLIPLTVLVMLAILAITCRLIEFMTWVSEYSPLAAVAIPVFALLVLYVAVR